LGWANKGCTAVPPSPFAQKGNFYDFDPSVLMPTSVSIHNPTYTVRITQLAPVNSSSEERILKVAIIKIICNIKHITDVPHNILNDRLINANIAKATGAISNKKATGKLLALLLPVAKLKAVNPLPSPKRASTLSTKRGATKNNRHIIRATPPIIILKRVPFDISIPFLYV
jgi:hypothetical protein